MDIFRSMIFYKWRKTLSWQALPFREMSCVVRCVYSPVHRCLYVDRIEGIMVLLVYIWYCIVYTKNDDRFVGVFWF